MDRPHRISFLALWLLPGVLCAGLIPEGPEFQVNTYTTGDQESPDVAMDGAGNFIVVWQSYGQDGGRQVSVRYKRHLRVVRDRS